MLPALYSCTKAKYASTEADEPMTDSGQTQAVDTGGPYPENSVILNGRWDGDDGGTFDWNDLPNARYDISITGPDGFTHALSSTRETTVNLTGLTTGEYTATLDTWVPSSPSIETAQVTQYVGPNRMVYRAEVPLFQAMDVWGVGDIAVIGGGTNETTSALVVDVSNPVDPVVIHTMKDIGFVRDIKIFDGLLFTAVDPDADDCTLCDDIGVRVYDFSDPENPILLSTIGSPASWVHNMTYSDGYLYLASMMEEAVAIVDMSDPKNPTRVATWYAELEPFSNIRPGPGGGPHDMVAQGDRLYVAHFTGFSIVDISDPTHPSALASVHVDKGMHNVWPNETGTLMVGTQEVFDGPLTLWDISDLGAIQLLDSISTGTDRCVHNGYFDGDSILAAWYIDGVFSFEIEANRLVETGHYDSYPGETPTTPEGDPLPVPPIEGAWGIWSFGKHMIVGDTERGMLILDHYPRVISSQ